MQSITGLSARVKLGVQLLAVALLSAYICMAAYVQLRFGGVRWWSWGLAVALILNLFVQRYQWERPRLSGVLSALSFALSALIVIALLAH